MEIAQVYDQIHIITQIIMLQNVKCTCSISSNFSKPQTSQQYSKTGSTKYEIISIVYLQANYAILNVTRRFVRPGHSLIRFITWRYRDTVLLRSIINI